MSLMYHCTKLDSLAIQRTVRLCCFVVITDGYNLVVLVIGRRRLHKDEQYVKEVKRMQIFSVLSFRMEHSNADGTEKGEKKKLKI